MSIYIWPPVQLSSAPLRYSLDGVSTEVLEDTVTTINSRPLPVKEMDSAGNIIGDGLAMVDFLTAIDTSTILAASATFHTFTVAIKKMRIVNNGGEAIVVQLNAVDIGLIAPGEKTTVDFKASALDNLDFRTLSGGAGAAGTLYLTFFS